MTVVTIEITDPSVTVTESLTTITVNPEGEVNTGLSLGTGADVYKQKTNQTLEFRSLTGSNLVNLTETGNSIDIEVDPADINTSEITNNSGWTSYDSSDFDTDFGTKSTTDLSEGTNLYYTDARANSAFDTRLATKDTDDLTEGTTNLYYTNERVDDRVANLLTEGSNITLTYNDSAGTLTISYDNTGGIDLSNNDTDDVSEGITNLYYTDTRARAAISGTGDISYNSSTGVISATTYKSADFDTDFGTKSTTDLSEGTNLYYTDERVDDRVANLLTEGTNISLTYNDSANTLTVAVDNTGGLDLANNDTDDMSEGSTNLYYTDARANSAIDTRVDKAFVDALNTDADTLDSQEGTYYLDYDNFTNTPTIASDTDGLTEGTTNLYYTDERVEDAVANLLTEGTNISLTYGDTAGTLTVAVDNTGGLDLANNNTDDMSEGSTNLYYTDTRANSAIDTRVNKAFVDALNIDADTLDGEQGTYYLDYDNFTNTPTIASDTDGLTEGTTNLYYTDARANSAFDTRLATKDTDDLTEGTTNLYYTNERVDDRVANLLTEGDNISVTYNDSANTLTVAVDNTGGLDLANNDTDDVSEGSSNLYYTDARANSAFDTRLATKDTDDLTEGTTNLYYTDERVDDRVSNLLVEGTDITLTYNDSANTITVAYNGSAGASLFANLGDVALSSTISDGAMLEYDTATDEWVDAGTFASQFSTQLGASDTDDVSEGSSNLYYTDERVEDAVANLLTEGTNISLTYGDTAGTLTVAVDNTGGLDLANNDTDDVSEGSTNLYYTATRVQTEIDSYVDAAFVNALDVTIDGGTY